MLCVRIRENDYGKMIPDVCFKENIGNVPPSTSHTPPSDLFFSTHLKPSCSYPNWPQVPEAIATESNTVKLLAVPINDISSSRYGQPSFPWYCRGSSSCSLPIPKHPHPFYVNKGHTAAPYSANDISRKWEEKVRIDRRKDRGRTVVCRGSYESGISLRACVGEQLTKGLMLLIWQAKEGY